jgi:photosystem II stability/assembly factor-like uncharacterized protein
MKSYYNLVKVTIIAFICLCFVFSMAINGEANVFDVSASLNPFYPYDNETTTIYYKLDNNAILWLRIYDLSGTLVRKLVTPTNNYTENRTNPPGGYNEVWDARNDIDSTIVPEGYYPYHIDDIAWRSTSSSNAYAVYDLVVDPSNSQILSVTDSGGRLLKSTDGGSTWSQVAYGGKTPAFGIAISNDGKKIFVLSYGSKLLYRSTDGGNTWSSLSLWSGAYYPYDIACSGDGTILYAVDQHNKYIYKSTDSGANWSSTGAYLGKAVKLTGVAVDPNNSNTVMVTDVGASSGGCTYATVYKSVNGGSSFTTALCLKGTADGKFKSGDGAYQISIDTNGYYWVSDRGNHRIQQFDSNNNWVMTVGGTSSGDTKYKFNSASVSLGIFVASFGGQQYLYVADFNNNKIKRFEYDNHVSFSDPYRLSDLPVSYLVVTTDKVCPDPVADLSTTGVVGSDSVQLTWTAPADATRYDVRYAKSEITTDAEFEAASHVPGASSQGATEYFFVRGLESNTTYHFAIKALDEAFNESDISNPSNPSGKTGLLKGWNLVSCPLQPIPDDTWSVFWDDAKYDYMFYWYSTWNGVDDPDYAGYYGDEYGQAYPYKATTVVPGRGILLWSELTSNPTDAVGSPIDTPSYNLSLSLGWNMIGNPYETSVYLKDPIHCKVEKSGDIRTYEQAVSAGWVENVIYIWNGSIYKEYLYEDPFNPDNDAVLEPWKGYWIFSYYNLDLIIYNPNP